MVQIESTQKLAQTDYTNARKIINGLDHAEEIATSAKKFEQILRESVGKSN